MTRFYRVVPDREAWLWENKTPGAYRIFWCYGPEKGEMTIIAIHPASSDCAMR